MLRSSRFVLAAIIALAGCGGSDRANPAPTATLTAVPTPTPTEIPPTVTRSVTMVPTGTHTAPPTATPSAVHTPTRSPSASVTQTSTHSPTRTATLSSTPTQTATFSPSAGPTSTATQSPSAEPTASQTATQAADHTETPTFSPSPEDSTPTTDPSVTPTLSTPAPTATPTTGGAGAFCDLPGSVQTTADGLVVVPGGPPGTPDLNFLHLPVGFCAHFYAKLGNPRQLRFAPGGDLFVASPTTFSTGGGPGGQQSIVILPDDDHDGMADGNITFLSSLPSTQGLLFANGHLYYQDRTKIRRIPFSPGDRTPSGQSEEVADINYHVSFLHWPKPIDIADDGTIYVGNGGDETDPCDLAHTMRGGIVKLDGAPGGTPVAKGFRNPISLRCRRGHNRCFAIELARDYSNAVGGREKIVPIQQDDDWGFPCCATKDVPYPGFSNANMDCSGVAPDKVQFFIGDTPFDLDFEMGKWPSPWNNRIFVPLHGAYGTWAGARVVTLELDPDTSELLPGSDLDGMMSTGAMRDFATGWADGTLAHGRPANVAFAPDGRLFLSNDVSGVILWIAPLGL